MALDLAGLIVFGQRIDHGVLWVDVGYAVTAMTCSHCGKPTNKVHYRSAQPKRDVPLRGRPCLPRHQRQRKRRCHKTKFTFRPRTFSEPDPVCGLGPKGWGRRTTQRLRQKIAEKLPHQTTKRVAAVYDLGQRSVRQCVAK